LALALDEPKETDATYNVDAFTYVIDKNLINAIQPVTIDYTAVGFSVTGNMTDSRFNAGRNSCA
jgi:Fe-S cluster assembly iron-binding protein IscA